MKEENRKSRAQLGTQELYSAAGKRIVALILIILISLVYLFRVPQLLSNNSSPENRLRAMSNAFHGSDLNSVVYSLQDEEYEYHVEFDIDGNKVFEHTDFNPDEVYTHGEALWLLMRSSAKIDLHNHPLSVLGPSIADLTNLDHQKPHGISLVVAGNCLYCFAAVDEWPSSDEMEQICNQARIAVGANSYSEVFEDLGLMNNFYSEVAKRGNLIYGLYILHYGLQPTEVVRHIRDEQQLRQQLQ